MAEFDDPVGIGEVEGDNGQRYFFHCTQIADGTRTIEVGVPVTFDVVAGHMGRWEAIRIEKVGIERVGIERVGIERVGIERVRVQEA